MTVTVIAAVPLVPSLVAVIVAEPAPTPLTSPRLETVATLESLLAHFRDRPVSGLPAGSFSVAMSWSVSPSWMAPDPGERRTEATTDAAGGPAASGARQLMTAPPAVIKAAERSTRKRKCFRPGQGGKSTSRVRIRTSYAASSTEFPT